MKKFCTNCGTELTEDSVFCTKCGRKTEAIISRPEANSTNCGYVRHTAPPSPNPPPRYSFNTFSQIPPMGRYKIVSTGAFFGLMFVFAIPFVGFIVSLVLSITAEKDNMKNFARASLIWSIIYTVLISVIFVFFYILGAESLSQCYARSFLW